jgi:hypothetical protein
VASPLVTLDGRALALVGQPRDLISLAAPARRPAARGLKPGTIAVAGGMLFAAGDRSVEAWRCRVRSTGAVSCRLQWRQKLGGAVTAPPLSTGDQVFVGSWDTHLYAFDRRSGHLLWRTRAGRRLAAPLLRWSDFLAAAADGVALVQFFRADNGAPAGEIQGQENEIFISGVAREGDILVTPVLPFPSLRPALRAYRVDIAAHDESRLSQSFETEIGDSASTTGKGGYSLLSADRNRDSRSR